MDYETLPKGWLKREDAEFLIELVKCTRRLEEFSVEIGSWYGRSSVVIGEEVQKYGGQLFCIDTWNQREWKDTAKSLSKKKAPFPMGKSSR